MPVDVLGYPVTPERIRALLRHYAVRSDTTSREVCLIVAALRAENERLRASIVTALEDYDRRDEISAVDTLRAALSHTGGELQE